MEAHVRLLPVLALAACAHRLPPAPPSPADVASYLRAGASVLALLPAEEPGACVALATVRAALAASAVGVERSTPIAVVVPEVVVPYGDCYPDGVPAVLDPTTAGHIADGVAIARAITDAVLTLPAVRADCRGAAIADAAVSHALGAVGEVADELAGGDGEALVGGTVIDWSRCDTP